MKKYIEIGERLRKLRAHRSQKEFAEKLGMPLRTYIYYESGERMPKGDVLYRIAAICEMPVEWIMTGKIETREMTEDDIKQCLYKEGYSKEEINAFIEKKKGEEKEKPGQVAEECAIYKVKEDPEIAEIIQMLKEHPQDKALVLKLLKGKKDIKEALEGFEISKIREQEG